MASLTCRRQPTGRHSRQLESAAKRIERFFDANADQAALVSVNLVDLFGKPHLYLNLNKLVPAGDDRPTPRSVVKLLAGALRQAEKALRAQEVADDRP